MIKVKATTEGQSFVNNKLCVHNNSKTSEFNLIKCHTMVKHNEKVCRAKNLGSTTKDTVIGYRFCTCIHNKSKKGLANLNQISKKGKP